MEAGDERDGERWRVMREMESCRGIKRSIREYTPCLRKITCKSI